MNVSRASLAPRFGDLKIRETRPGAYEFKFSVHKPDEVSLKNFSPEDASRDREWISDDVMDISHQMSDGEIPIRQALENAAQNAVQKSNLGRIAKRNLKAALNAPTLQYEAGVHLYPENSAYKHIVYNARGERVAGYDEQNRPVPESELPENLFPKQWHPQQAFYAPAHDDLHARLYTEA